MTIIVRGFLNELLVTRGYAAAPPVAPIRVFADPRQGVTIPLDNDPAAVDPRQGIVLTH
jgi:hypothetical protein